MCLTLCTAKSCPSAMMEKVKPVLDTSYKPYVNDGNQEDNNKPNFYRTTEGQLVLKKVVSFYNKVPMPCVPVPEQDLCVVPVHQSPKCFLGHSQVLAWRSCHSPAVMSGLLEACT
ncbi:hypothetical protein DSO57_1020421 [Entomophthora muscae]|uniref:Uncharacterized protein n=1 Tax=Entomophthora muscae TaxID=34485 RepID=A0ACC2RUV3_9FUNG|nr:hypothetical protein DSO57_1020421 [Entomophthora muscae]